MKIKAICYLSLMMIGSVAGAQQYGPCGGPSPTALVNWTKFHSDVCNTGYNANEFILSPATVGNLALDWEYTTGGMVASSPAVADGAVYVSDGGLNLYALSASTGALLWKYMVEGGLSSPAVANGVVYVGSGINYVYALNASDGTLKWRYTTGLSVNSSPAVASGVVYVGSDDSNVYALNASDGTLKWRYTTGQNVVSSPAVANGVVYVGSYDHNLYALNADTGALVWKYATGGEIGDSSPAVANGVVYFGSDDSNVYALNASTGMLVWKYTTGDGSSHRPRWLTAWCTSGRMTITCTP